MKVYGITGNYEHAPATDLGQQGWHKYRDGYNPPAYCHGHHNHDVDGRAHYHRHSGDAVLWDHHQVRTPDEPDPGHRHTP